MKIKTIDLQAKQWRDRVNGNSYFSVRITLNYGSPKQKTIYLPFQYGYGSQYEDSAKVEMVKQGYLKLKEPFFSFSRICRDAKIIYRQGIETNCLKRKVTEWGKP